jgi:hypothetical protein
MLNNHYSYQKLKLEKKIYKFSYLVNILTNSKNLMKNYMKF